MLGNYPVDGCVDVEEDMYILQYDGCYWHGCDFFGYLLKDMLQEMNI